jgi:hypothetical protein
MAPNPTRGHLHTVRSTSKYIPAISTNEARIVVLPKIAEPAQDGHLNLDAQNTEKFKREVSPDAMKMIRHLRLGLRSVPIDQFQIISLILILAPLFIIHEALTLERVLHLFPQSSMPQATQGPINYAIDFNHYTSLFYNSQNSKLREGRNVQTLSMEFEVESTKDLFSFAEWMFRHFKELKDLKLRVWTQKNQAHFYENSGEIKYAGWSVGRTVESGEEAGSAFWKCQRVENTREIHILVQISQLEPLQ